MISSVLLYPAGGYEWGNGLLHWHVLFAAANVLRPRSIFEETTGELYADRDVGYIIEDSKYHFSSWNLSFRKETGGVVSYRNVEDKYR